MLPGFLFLTPRGSIAVALSFEGDLVRATCWAPIVGGAGCRLPDFPLKPFRCLGDGTGDGVEVIVGLVGDSGVPVARLQPEGAGGRVAVVDRARSEGRRVGKEWVGKGRFRW